MLVIHAAFCVVMRCDAARLNVREPLLCPRRSRVQFNINNEVMLVVNRLDTIMVV